MLSSSTQGDRKRGGAHAPVRNPLVEETTSPVRALVLDPGDELAAVDNTALDTDPGFLLAFVPIRSFQRLAEADLGALTASIVRNPSVVDGHILARPLDDGRFVVIDGIWHVTALKKLAEQPDELGVDLPDDVRRLIDACPIRVVAADTDPAFVLSLLGNQRDDSDPWLLGQRDRLLRQLAHGGRSRSTYDVAISTGGSRAAMRKYHAYRSLEQFLQYHPVSPDHAASIFPLLHVALARTVVRTWLDWDDHLCAFLDDTALEVFYRLLLPDVDVDGSYLPPCISSVEEMVHLCDVLENPAAKRALVEQHATLAEAVRVVEDGDRDVWVDRLGDAISSMRWDQQRFRGRF